MRFKSAFGGGFQKKKKKIMTLEWQVTMRMAGTSPEVSAFSFKSGYGRLTQR